MSNRHHEACKAAMRGWALMPLRGKIPVLKGWQNADHPSGKQVADWLCGQFNLGLRTGDVSGVSVIDVESDATHLLDLFPSTVTVETGSGGYHLYYRHIHGIRNGCRSLVDPWTGEHIPSVDVRGDGGQVVFVGSIHPDTGREYRWVDDHNPNDIPLARFPNEFIPPAPPRPLVHATTPKDMAEAEKRAWNYVRKCGPAISGQGGRQTAFKVSVNLAEFGITRLAHRNMMEWYNAEKCDPPWPSHNRDWLDKINHGYDTALANGNFGRKMES